MFIKVGFGSIIVRIKCCCVNFFVFFFCDLVQGVGKVDYGFVFNGGFFVVVFDINVDNMNSFVEWRVLVKKIIDYSILVVFFVGNDYIGDVFFYVFEVFVCFFFDLGYVYLLVLLFFWVLFDVVVLVEYVKKFVGLI